MACVVACVLRCDGKVARVSASGSHDGRMRPPVGLRNRWLSKEGTKGGGCCCLWFLCCLWLLSSLDGGGGRWWSTCGGGGFGGLAEAIDNDCVRAHDAHEFSIDLRSQPMPLKINESTCATCAQTQFLSSRQKANIVWLRAIVLQKKREFVYE